MSLSFHTPYLIPRVSAPCLTLHVSEIPFPQISFQIPLDNKVEITFHYRLMFSLVKRVNIHRTAVSVLEEMFQCVVACGLIEQEKRCVCVCESESEVCVKVKVKCVCESESEVCVCV